MPKSRAAATTGRPAVRTAWAKAVRSSDTVLVLQGMIEPPLRSDHATSATHVPALPVTHVPAPFTKGRHLAAFDQSPCFPVFAPKAAKDRQTVSPQSRRPCLWMERLREN